MPPLLHPPKGDIYIFIYKYTNIYYIYIFNFKLFQNLSTDKDANYFVTPFNILTALSMILCDSKFVKEQT